MKAASTKRRRAEGAVRENEARERARADELQALIEAFPAVVFISRDPSCQKMSGNRASYEIPQTPPGANVSKSAKGE